MDREMPYKDEPGLQDATVTDFILPLLMARLPFPKGASAPKSAPAAAPLGRSIQGMEDVAGSEVREAMLRSMELPAKGYAAGGIVEPDLGQLPMPNETPAAPTVPGILDNARSLGRNLYGGYTPELRTQLYAMMAERANSMPNAIGSGLASVGDAITRGFGRSQSNYLDKAHEIQRQGRADVLGAFDAAQKGTLGMAQSGLELGKITPDSDLSKITQEAYAAPLRKLGYTDEQIAKMPASQIESVAQVGLKFADIESQNELKRATIELQAMLNSSTIVTRKQELELQKLRAEAEARDKEAQRAKDVANIQRESAVETLKRGGNARVFGLPIPFTSDVSGKQMDKARKVLETQMAGDVPGLAHPEASQAEEWALAHPDDPRSKEILSRLKK